MDANNTFYNVKGVKMVYLSPDRVVQMMDSFV